MEEAALGKHLGAFIQPPAQHSASVITAQEMRTRRFFRLGAGRIEGHQNEQAASGLRRRLRTLMYRQLSSQNGLSRTKTASTDDQEIFCDAISAAAAR